MIKIVTDSTCGVSKEFAEANDIRVVPLKVMVGDKEFEEAFSDVKLEMYEEVAKTKIFPKTSLPSVQKFVEYFNEVIASGDIVLCITISSTLSGTYNAAVVARSSCAKPESVHVVDSGVAIQAVLGMIEEILPKTKKDSNIKAILNDLENMKQESGVAFLPDTLSYLHKGGRISGLVSLIGTVLNIKPIIKFAKGILSNYKKALGLNSAIASLVNVISRSVKKIFVVRIGNSQNCAKLKEAIDAKFADTAKIEEGLVGPVVGSHVGYAIGVAWVGTPTKNQ